jgi:hypothetical protein
LGVWKITQMIKKKYQSRFILLKRAQAVVQKTSRKNVTSTVFIFSFFLYFLWTSWVVEKSHATQKNCTKIEKVETHAHRKRARSALTRERTLELR